MRLARLVFSGERPYIMEDRPAVLRRLRREADRQGWSTLPLYYNGSVLHGLYNRTTQTGTVFTLDLQAMVEVTDVSFLPNRRGVH